MYVELWNKTFDYSFQWHWQLTIKKSVDLFQSILFVSIWRAKIVCFFHVKMQNLLIREVFDINIDVIIENVIYVYLIKAVYRY